MKIIKVSTELEMSVHEFPEGTMREQNKALYDLIGNGCDIVEHVMPKRLYRELKMPSTPVKEPGKCVSMLIDEEGRLKPNKANLIGSYLYEFDKHGCPIVGNILFIGEKMGDDGVEFCGISEENFSLLETELKNMITAMKTTVPQFLYGGISNSYIGRLQAHIRRTDIRRSQNEGIPGTVPESIWTLYQRCEERRTPWTISCQHHLGPCIG